jgi:hypothetical protein
MFATPPSPGSLEVNDQSFMLESFAFGSIFPLS